MQTPDRVLGGRIKYKIINENFVSTVYTVEKCPQNYIQEK